MKAKQYDAAVDSYQGLLQLDKDDAAAQAGLKVARAALTIDAAQKKLADAFQAHVNAAEKALADGNLNLARQDIAAARALRPTSPILGLLQRQHDQKLAQAKVDPPKNAKDPPDTKPPVKNGDLDLLLKQALAARNAQRWKKAEQLYRQVQEINRADAQAAIGLEAVQQAQQQARAEYERLLQHAKQAMQFKQTLNAINLLQQADRIFPENAEVQPLLRQAELLHEQFRKSSYVEAMDRARAFRGQNRYKDAMQAYEQALLVFPQDPNARQGHTEVRLMLENDLKSRYLVVMGRANLLKTQKKYAEAILAYDEALQILPDDAAARSNRADAVRLMNADGGAAKDANPKKKKNDPVNPPPPNPMNLTVEQVQRFNQAMNQGFTALKQGQAQVAEQFFQTALEISPGNALAEGWLKIAREQKAKTPKK